VNRGVSKETLEGQPPLGRFFPLGPKGATRKDVFHDGFIWSELWTYKEP
jgi:hypothetical protein